MNNSFKKIWNRYLSPYSNRNFEPLIEWQNLVDIAAEYNDSEYAKQQATISSEFLSKRLVQLGFYDGGLALDLGCGYGQWTLALSILNGSAVGVDLHPNRIEIAKKLAKRSLQEPKHLKFFQGNAEQLDSIEDNSVDFVYCFGVFMFLHKKRALDEIRRVLRPGGRLYICTNSYGWWLYLAICRGFGNRHLMLSSLKALTLGSRGIPSSMTRGSLNRMLKKTGFENVITNLEGRINSTQAMNTYRSRFLFFPICIESIATKPLDIGLPTFENGISKNYFERIDKCKPLELGMRDSIVIERSLLSRELKGRLAILQRISNPVSQISEAHRFIAEEIIHNLQFQPLNASHNIPQNVSVNLALKSGRCGAKARALADLLVLLGWSSGIIVTGHHVNTWIRYQGTYMVLDCDIFAPGQISLPDTRGLIPLDLFINQDPQINFIANSYHYLLKGNRGDDEHDSEGSHMETPIPSTLLNSEDGELVFYERRGSKDVLMEVVRVPKRKVLFMSPLPNVKIVNEEIFVSGELTHDLSLFGSSNNSNTSQRIIDLKYIRDFRDKKMPTKIVPPDLPLIAVVPNGYTFRNPGLLASLHHI